MTEFIYGRAGSGKTHNVCLAAADAVKRGERVFLIVPEQTALDTEAKITALMGDTPSLSLEILNFRRLCNRIFREYGGLSYNYITKSGKQLMMWRTLTELAPMLTQKTPPQRANVSQMLGAVAEMKAYRISPAALERAAKGLPPNSHKKLADKLLDLSLIFASYTNLVGETLDDAADDLTKAAELLRGKSLFRGAHVCFDAFNGFTPQEYALIEEIFRQAKDVTVSMCLDGTPERSKDELFQNQVAAASKLKRLAENAGCQIKETVLRRNRRTASQELAFLESSLWSLDLTESDACTSDTPPLKLVSCPDLFSECEAAATDICRLVREGASWRDFSVITRGVDRYNGILDVIFEKYGIPHFTSRRTDIKNKPLMKLILSALTLRSGNFRTSDVISYIKTGLCGITPDEISQLENYAELWKIRGVKAWTKEWEMNPSGYTADFTEKAARSLDRINEIREKIVTPLIDLHSALDNAVDVRDHSRALYNYLCALEIPKKLSAAAKEQRKLDPAAAKETEQLYGILIDALDQLCAVMPDMPTDCASYGELLKIIFDETDIGRIPATVDEVIIGDASLLRAGGKHIFILGANEGIFPMTPSEYGIFTDSDREVLANAGIELAGGAQSEAADERFHFYRALTSASHSLTVIWSSSDLSGHTMKPSFGVTRLRALFPKVKVTDYSALPITDRLEGRANLLEFIAETDKTPLGAALREYAERDESLSPRLKKLDIPLSEEQDCVSADTCRELFPGDLALTQSRLEAYVLCRFSYFCKYILKLEEKKSSGFDAADMGTFIHHVLEKFMSAIKDSDDIAAITDKEIDDIVEDIITAYMAEVCRIAPEFSGSRIAHLFARLRRSSRLLCKNLTAEFSESRFRPAFFELPIRRPVPGETAVEPLNVKLSDGAAAYIYGIADRVDIYQNNGKYYVRVVDYKTGAKDFSEENIKMGLDLQMLLYLFSIEKNGANPRGAMEFAKDSRILPAGVLYFSAGVPTVTLEREASAEEVEQLVQDKLARRGLLLDDPDVLRAMESELSGKYLPVRMKKDGSFTNSDSLTSLDGFKALLSSIEDTVRGIGNEIKRGNASASPLKNKKQDACKYCEMRPICRKAADGKGK